jgi:hypothetical protein
MADPNALWVWIRLWARPEALRQGSRGSEAARGRIHRAQQREGQRIRRVGPGRLPTPWARPGPVPTPLGEARGVGMVGIWPAYLRLVLLLETMPKSRRRGGRHVGAGVDRPGVPIFVGDG